MIMKKKSLVIIEAFGKKDRIKDLFSQCGIDCHVFATLGNILDLPKDEFAINTELMRIEKKTPVRPDIYEKIISINIDDYEKVYLATDNDVVGESIARDFIKIKNLNNFIRIRLNDLNLTSLKKALLNGEKKIDEKIINEADAKRISDRIIGYYGQHDKKKMSISFGRVATPLLSLAKKANPVVKIIKHRFFEAKDPIPFELNIPIRKNNVRYAGIIEKKLLNVNNVCFAGIPVNTSDSQVPATRPCNTSDILNRVSGLYDKEIKDVMNSLQKVYESGKCSYLRTESNRLSLDDSGELSKTLLSKGFLVEMEKIAEKWFYPLENDYESDINAHPAITLKTKSIMTSNEPNSTTEDHIVTEIFEASKNSINDIIYSRKIDETITPNIDPVLSDLLSIIDCQPVWKRSFLKRHGGATCDVVVNHDSDAELKIMTYDNALKHFHNKKVLEIKKIPNERILLNILTETKIGRPSTYIHHCVKLKKHFLDDFGLSKSFFNSIKFADENIPSLKEPNIVRKVENILSKNNLDVYNKVDEVLKIIGINTDRMDLAPSETGELKTKSSDSELDF